VGSDKRVESLADHDAEVLQPHLVDALMHGRDELDERDDLTVEDFTHVKFYRLSLRASVELDAGPFDDGFHHVDDWVPQRLVTATARTPCRAERRPQPHR